MKPTRRTSLGLHTGLAGSLALALPAAGAQQLKTTAVASGLNAPVAAAVAPGDAQRLFVIERSGRVRVVHDGTLLAAPFLDLSGEVSLQGDGGLLGIAFHPDYATNQRFYVAFSDLARDAVVREYLASDDPNVAQTTGWQTVFGPLFHGVEHYALDLQFGPDGMLWVSIGASAQNLAQDLQSYEGKLLRIDVDAPAPHVPVDNPYRGPSDGALDLIWASGLRNPWRFSFDEATGDLYIGDVGESTREEIDFQPASAGDPGSPGYQGGRNYGWACMEGTHCFSAIGCSCGDPALTPPIFELGASAISITGGRVYRGTRIPELQGKYLCLDFGTNQVWSFRVAGGVATEIVEHDLTKPSGAGVNNAVSFAVDAEGELLVVNHYDGQVLRIDPVCETPEKYCVATANSLGVPASIGHQGSASVSADDLVLRATQCPSNVPGFFFHGPLETQVPLANGWRCVAGTLVRLPLSPTDASGVATHEFDAAGAGMAAGTTRCFQYYFRDTGAGGALANLSDGLRAQFCP